MIEKKWKNLKLYFALSFVQFNIYADVIINSDSAKYYVEKKQAFIEGNVTIYYTRKPLVYTQSITRFQTKEIQEDLLEELDKTIEKHIKFRQNPMTEESMTEIIEKDFLKDWDKELSQEDLKQKAMEDFFRKEAFVKEQLNQKAIIIKAQKGHIIFNEKNKPIKGVVNGCVTIETEGILVNADKCSYDFGSNQCECEGGNLTIIKNNTSIQGNRAIVKLDDQTFEVFSDNKVTTIIDSEDF